MAEAPNGYTAADIAAGDRASGERQNLLYAKTRLLGFGAICLMASPFLFMLGADLEADTYPLSNGTCVTLMLVGVLVFVVELIEAVFIMCSIGNIFYGVWVLIRDAGRPIALLMLSQYFGEANPSNTIVYAFVPLFLTEALFITEYIHQYWTGKKYAFDMDTAMLNFFLDRMQLFARSMGSLRSSSGAFSVAAVSLKSMFVFMLLKIYVLITLAVRLSAWEDGSEGFSWWVVLWPWFLAATVGALVLVVVTVWALIKNFSWVAVGNALVINLLMWPLILMPWHMLGLLTVSWFVLLYPLAVACVFAFFAGLYTYCTVTDLVHHAVEDQADAQV